MSNGKNLKRIESHSGLNKQWILFLKAKGLARFFAAARSNDAHATLEVVGRTTDAEDKAFPSVHAIYEPEWDRIPNLYHLPIAKAKGVSVGDIYSVFAEDPELCKKTDALVLKSPEWKKPYKKFQKLVWTNLDAIADLKKGAFGKSEHFSAWVEASLPPKKIADLLKLKKFKKSDIVDLSTGFVLDDTGKMAQAVKALEKSGLTMKPAAVAGLLQSKFGKFKL